jgi:hypothetical protein
VLNNIVQNILEKYDVKEKDPKGIPKTLMPLTWVQNLDVGENREGNLKRDQVAHLWG